MVMIILKNLLERQNGIYGVEMVGKWRKIVLRRYGGLIVEDLVY